MTNEQTHRSTFFLFPFFWGRGGGGWCDTLQSWHWLLSPCTRCKWGCEVEPVQASSVAPIKPAGQKRKWKCHANVFVML